MGYKVRLDDADKRRELIAKRAKEAETKRSFKKEFKFRNGEDLPLIQVPIDALLYRLENHRTRDQQLTREATGKVPAGFFDPSRREDPSVQQKQHEILIGLAHEGSGETIKPIYDELARVAEQQSELIITAEGVVVNGNRRLCAMRELLKGENSSGYGRFENVLCAVLPSRRHPALSSSGV